jgi:hypothetical protein
MIEGGSNARTSGSPECSFSLPLDVLAAVPAEAWVHEWSLRWLRLPVSV